VNEERYFLTRTRFTPGYRGAAQILSVCSGYSWVRQTSDPVR
jgi:hypothetical protein